ncbi:MAG: indolepyruvate ferredoxin oxidoreductase family protein [Rhodospirillales bacterium]|nr:indolepyruvate ferredoxin oxidoreductase family protein [Rhodospirillales bacterium]
MPDASLGLDDKYTLESGRIFLTGIQALVRLPMMQQQRDRAQGLNTGGYITGYRGSPLGGLDQQLWKTKRLLDRNNIVFRPGLNEDLAATAIWGTQQSNLFGDSTVDGVYAMWYGKGPGVDRCGDVFRHGNLAGSSKHGGVLLLAGDDHAAKSSTAAHQCEYAFMDAMVPTLAPAGVQEFLDLGLYGWALSRYSGCWVGFKCVGETAEAASSCLVDPERIAIREPDDFEMPTEGLNIRWNGALDMMNQEARHHYQKLYAALAFARANRLNRTVIDSPKRRIGIVSAGKSYLDVCQVLDDLGIDGTLATEIGISLYKVGMVWPLERDGIRAFAEGLDEILVVEEKRAVIENQIKEQLYNWRADVRPHVVGKFDEDNQLILPANGELTPARIARVIAARIARFHDSPRIAERLAFLDSKEKDLHAEPETFKRIPTFCSGCPHNSSTKVPDGSRALAGIGCHYMVQWMDRNTETFTQMGGEGVTWVGQAPFSKTKHVFANLGDGTYEHSGLLAIRQAVAAGVNITYKILFNDAVAMTGGQPVASNLSPASISRQIAAEGVGAIVVVTDEPDKYPLGTDWAPSVTIEHRSQLETVQLRLRALPGVTAIIYDQTCAAEKRRRRKRGLYPDPPKRAFINEAVCEGCGDCSLQSNCVSVVPVETDFGRKRAVDQSSCNKDFSCIDGFCPSFVTVHGGRLKRKRPKQAHKQAKEFAAWETLPEPSLPTLDRPYNVLVTGIGGTGVVTIGALLGMAAHIEGRGCSILDQTGLAQKGGAVMSHVRIAETPEQLSAVRIAAGGADVMLGCDLVVSASAEARGTLDEARSRAIVNSYEQVTGDFARNPDLSVPGKRLAGQVRRSVGDTHFELVDAHGLATALMGDSIATNLFMLGFAWQRGFVPVGEAALMQAVELNKVAIDFNKQAFLWGRRAAHNLAAVQRVAFGTPEQTSAKEPETDGLEALISRRVRFLTDYQNAKLAQRYRQLVERVASAERAKTPDLTGLAEAAARYYAKLLAIKDEYEVARLYSDPSFQAKLEETFEGDIKLSVHLAPPLFSKRDPRTGHLMKREYGPWIFRVFSLLARLRGLRGTAFDLFGHTQERRSERQLIDDYEALVTKVLADLEPGNHQTAVALLSLPEKIRGYGHVKEANVVAVKQEEEALLARLQGAETPPAIAAE